MPNAGIVTVALFGAATAQRKLKKSVIGDL
jgi:hypothetical protein